MRVPNRDTLLQVKELVEKCGDDILEIAHRLHIDPEVARQWVDIVVNLWS